MKHIEEEQKIEEDFILQITKNLRNDAINLETLKEDDSTKS
jgi:hypothetical protein